MCSEHEMLSVVTICAINFTMLTVNSHALACELISSTFVFTNSLNFWFYSNFLKDTLPMEFKLIRYPQTLHSSYLCVE